MPVNDARGYAQFLAALVFVLLVAVGAWDIWAWFKDRPTATVSNIVHGWCTDYPGFAFFLGFLVCHILRG